MEFLLHHWALFFLLSCVSFYKGITFPFRYKYIFYRLLPADMVFSISQPLSVYLLISLSVSPSPLMIIFRQVAQGLLEKYNWQPAMRAPCWITAACPAWSSAPEQWSPTTLLSCATTRPILRIWKTADLKLLIHREYTHVLVRNLL